MDFPFEIDEHTLIWYGKVQKSAFFIEKKYHFGPNISHNFGRNVKKLKSKKNNLKFVKSVPTFLHVSLIFVVNCGFFQFCFRSENYAESSNNWTKSVHNKKLPNFPSKLKTVFKISDQKKIWHKNEEEHVPGCLLRILQ